MSIEKGSVVVVQFGKRMNKRKAGYPGADLPTSYVCKIARECVAEVFGISSLTLKNPSRGGREAAFARQVAIHLAHIVAGRRHDAVAKEFDRNRSTASHHFEVVENLRDEPTFDAFLTLLEQRFAHFLNYAATRPHGAWVPTLDALAKAVATGVLDADAHYEAKFLVETFRPRQPRTRAK